MHLVVVTSHKNKISAMLFFDFLFLNIFLYYSSFKEKGAASTSATVVGALLTMNIISIIMVIEIIVKDKIDFTLIGIVVFILSQIITYLRYIRNLTINIETLEKKWQERTVHQRKGLLRGFWVYGILTIGSAFGIAIFVGSLN